jgi:hypothetical protein
MSFVLIGVRQRGVVDSNRLCGGDVGVEELNEKRESSVWTFLCKDVCVSWDGGELGEDAETASSDIPLVRLGDATQ